MYVLYVYINVIIVYIYIYVIGIAPLLTSGLITQLIARTNILESVSTKVNSKNQIVVEKNVEKLLGIGLCLAQAGVCVNTCIDICVYI
jgi:preprotein translocase subunit SecY